MYVYIYIRIDKYVYISIYMCVHLIIYISLYILCFEVGENKTKSSYLQI